MIGHRLILLVASVFSPCVCFAVAGAAPTTLPITQILEQRYHDDDLAVVLPQRQELFCRTGKDGWNFAFAGFETKLNEPLHIEITGSGQYEQRDIFSLAAISI